MTAVIYANDQRHLEWSSLFPFRDELVNYYTRFASHFGLDRCTLFGQSVQSASWNETRNLWELVCNDSSTNREMIYTADILIQAVGTYNRKKYPNLPGMNLYNGEVFHTADWAAATEDFTGKRVGYVSWPVFLFFTLRFKRRMLTPLPVCLQVGTGPTAMQALPAIQSAAKSITICKYIDG